MPRRDFDQVSYNRSAMQQDLQRVREIYKEGALEHARKKAAQKKARTSNHRLSAKNILEKQGKRTDTKKIERLKRYLNYGLLNKKVSLKSQDNQKIELETLLRAIESRDKVWIVLESGRQLSVTELNGSPIKWSAVRGIFVERANAEKFIKEADERGGIIKSNPSSEFDQAASNF